MKLDVIRYRQTPNDVLSKLYIDGVFRFYILEPRNCIPPGTYLLKFHNSPRFSKRYGHDMIWLSDVPKRQYILIHKGNTAKDSSGCLLIGQSSKQFPDHSEVSESKLAYDEFYPLVSEAMKKGDVRISVCWKGEQHD